MKLIYVDNTGEIYQVVLFLHFFVLFNLIGLQFKIGSELFLSLLVEVEANSKPKLKLNLSNNIQGKVKAQIQVEFKPLKLNHFSTKTVLGKFKHNSQFKVYSRLKFENKNSSGQIQA